MNKIDLHIHTTMSDGSLTPNEIIREAKRLGLKTISITDHEGVFAYEQITESLEGIKLIPGIELSAFYKKGQLDILGYDIDLKSPRLLETLEKLKEARIVRIRYLIKALKNKYQIKINEEDENKIINRPWVGKPHVALWMVENGLVNTVKEAFSNYIYTKAVRMPDELEHSKMTWEECIDLIKEANGIPVLAHPNLLKLDRKALLQKVAEMKDYGLQGIEVWHSSFKEEEREFYNEIANIYGLLKSGGTDFHGSNVKPDVLLGSGTNDNVKIKQLSILNAIKERNHKRKL